MEGIAIMLTQEQRLEALKQFGITPNLLNPEQLAQMLVVFKATGQLFKGDVGANLYLVT